MLFSRMGRESEAIRIGEKLIPWPEFESSLLACCGIAAHGSTAQESDTEFSKIASSLVEFVCKAIQVSSGRLRVQQQSERRWLALARLAVETEQQRKLGEQFLAQAEYRKSGEAERKLTGHLLKLLGQRAFELVIQKSKALNNLAYSYASLGIRLDEASARSRESVSLLDSLLRDTSTEKLGQVMPVFRPEESRAFKYDTRGWISFRRGDLDDAIKHLEKACDLAPYDADIHYHLARAYEDRLQRLWPNREDGGSRREALGSLRKALRHYHYAVRFNATSRLASRLGRLRPRLAQYEANWEPQRQGVREDKMS
jgi:tetratricopeptide (TPR) repeat protein